MAYQSILRLIDFSPASQDAIALRLIHETGADVFFETGQINNALFLCSKRWASFPGSTAGQHQQKMADLTNAFIAAGGTVAA